MAPLVPERFALAPMTLGLLVLTAALWVLPVLFALSARAVPAPMSVALYACAAFMVVLYGSVYFVWRPRAFVVDSTSLTLEWPVRKCVISRSHVTGVRVVSSKEFRSEYGFGIRIGAGGLWGGFGWLKCGATTFSMWISRTDQFVLVTLKDAKPLMITPVNPERFAARLRQ